MASRLLPDVFSSQLGKRSIATEDDINRLAYAAEKKVSKTRNIKRV